MNSDIEINNLNSLNNIRLSYIAPKSFINNLDLKKKSITFIISREINKKLYIT